MNSKHIQFFTWSFITTICSIIFSQFLTKEHHPFFGKLDQKVIHQQLDTYLESYEHTGDYSGCVGIYKNGKKWYEKCLGKANYSFDLDHNTKSKFKIGSISKQITAVAILRLEELGKLKTTDTINRFFPEIQFPLNITIHQLLTHTSGVPDIYELSNFKCLFMAKSTLTDLIKSLMEESLNFSPGSRYQYSNGGYIILAGIIEEVSGMDYGQFLQQEIFSPLKMSESGHYATNEVVPNLTIGYDPKGYSDVTHCEWINDDLLKGAGSVYSTLNDMNVWILSVKDQQLLTPSSYKMMLSDYGNQYGYGISVYQSGGEHVFGHDGRISGYIADYLHYREDDVSIVVLGNIQTGVADFLRSDLRAIMKGHPRKSKAKSQPASSNTDTTQSKKTGIYEFGPDLKVKVILNDEMLYVQANEGGYSELIHLENGQYFSRTLYSTIDFIMDKSREEWKMLWINNEGRTFEGLRL